MDMANHGSFKRISTLVLGGLVGLGCGVGEDTEESVTTQALLSTFSDVPYFGSVSNYSPRTGSRWTVASDQGDLRYWLRTSNYQGQTNLRLGEYSIVRMRSYTDCMVRVSARSNENLGSNPAADLAILFGWKDADNYSYLQLSARVQDTRLVTVIAGVGTVVATAAQAGIQDNGYHAIEVWRHGGWIRALVDGNELLSVRGSTSEQEAALRIVGAVGLGSYDDSAYFDNIDVVDYQSLVTDHYQISLPSTGSPYADSVAALLENAYAVNVWNTWQDVNLRLSHDRYVFAYRPSGWRWWDDPQGIPLGGGLTITGGPSAVLSDLLPESQLPASERNVFLAISLHELGNGWGMPDGGEVLPQWLRSESHSGFLRAEAELALNYCNDANVEHANHLADYRTTSLDDRRNNGASVEPLLMTLVENYGWGMFRNLYAKAVSGGFAYLSGMSANDIDNELTLFLSQQVHFNLTQFFQSELGIVPNQTALDGVQGLPRSDIWILPALPCRAPALHATPEEVDIEATTNQPTATGIAYVASPLPWTAQITGDPRLTLVRTGESNNTTLAVRADLTGLPEGSKLVSWLTIRGSWTGAKVVRIPVVARVAMPLTGPVVNSSFENGSGGLPSSWSGDAWMPGDSNVLFEWTSSQRHVGQMGVCIKNLVPNDSRWLQPVTGLTPGMRYELVGWLKGSAISGGGGFINIFGTWDRAGLAGTFDWTKVTLPFVAPDSGELTVACRLGFWGETITGQLWCDDLQIVPATP
jgi:hypothetical protein